MFRKSSTYFKNSGVALPALKIQWFEYATIFMHLGAPGAHEILSPNSPMPQPCNCCALSRVEEVRVKLVLKLVPMGNDGFLLLRKIS
jgi:hypothetical protein